MNIAQARRAGWGDIVHPRVAFLRKAFGLFTSSLIVSALVAAIALHAGADDGEGGAPAMVVFFAEHPLLAFGVAMGSGFAASAVRHVPGLNLVALFAMAAVQGLILAPALFFAQVVAGVGDSLSESPVRDAFILSAIAFVGLTLYVLIAKRDFSFLAGTLAMGGMVVLGATLLNLLLGSALLGLAISSVGVLLFGAYVLFNTSRLLKSDEDDVVGFAISLYFNFLSLFSSILHLLTGRSR